jgi:molecular chaperone HscC
VVRPAPESREAGSEDSAAFQGAGETENRWIESLLEQIESIARQCLDDAGFRSQHVDLLILAGSGPCLPVVREWLETRFPNAAEGCFPPQELVARGAAVFAGHLAGGAGLQDLAVSEVACHSLTAAVLPAADAEPADCGYCPLIGRGTPLPAGCQQRFATTRANQTELHFRLYQGEQRDEPGNLLVDEFVLQGIPAAAERSEIGVRFAYDADELLRIEVALSKPQEQALLTIRRPRPATTAEQLALAATELQAIWNLRRSSSPR